MRLRRLRDSHYRGGDESNKVWIKPALTDTLFPKGKRSCDGRPEPFRTIKVIPKQSLTVSKARMIARPDYLIVPLSPLKPKDQVAAQP